MSTISVIVPCYNYGRFLHECIDSVLTQAERDVEVLIIDDASSDETPEVGAELAETDGRVEFRRHRVNRGHIATYNEGLEWARGDYTILISADDLLADGALMRAAQLMDEHPEVGLVYGRGLRFRSGSSRASVQLDPVRFRIVSGQEWLRDRCRAGGDTCIPSASAVVRTKLQQELGGYREELPYSGDGEMWMRFAIHASIGFVDAVQAYVRRHEENMTHQFASPLRKLQQQKAALDSVFDGYAELMKDQDLLRALSSRALARDALWSVVQLIYRGEADTARAMELMRFAVDVCGPDGLGNGAGTAPSGALRAASLPMLVGPFLDGLSRWPRGWINGRLEARRES